MKKTAQRSDIRQAVQPQVTTHLVNLGRFLSVVRLAPLVRNGLSLSSMNRAISPKGSVAQPSLVRQVFFLSAFSLYKGPLTRLLAQQHGGSANSAR